MYDDTGHPYHPVHAHTIRHVEYGVHCSPVYSALFVYSVGDVLPGKGRCYVS